MGRRRRLAIRVGAAVASISGLWLFVTAGNAKAASNPSSVDSAWWNMASAGPVTAPSLTTGTNQLQVGEGVNGPLAYAAVRFQLPSNIDPQSATVVLRLDVVQTGTVGTPVVAACVTTGSWGPGGDQAPSSAPGYSCGEGKESAGTVSGSSETWSLSSAFQAPGGAETYEIALVPDPGTSTPFSVDYSQPTPSSVLVNGSAAPPASTPSDAGSVSQPAPSGIAPSAAGSQSGPDVPTGVAAVPVNSSPLSSGAPAPSLAAGPTSPTTAVAAPGNLRGGAHPGTGAVVLPSTGIQARRVMAASVLLALGAALYMISRRPVRAPKLIGAFAPDELPAPPARVGGIGRFARPRTGRPPRLS